MVSFSFNILDYTVKDNHILYKRKKLFPIKSQEIVQIFILNWDNFQNFCENVLKILNYPGIPSLSLDIVIDSQNVSYKIFLKDIQEASKKRKQSNRMFQHLQKLSLIENLLEKPHLQENFSKGLIPVSDIDNLEDLIFSRSKHLFSISDYEDNGEKKFLYSSILKFRKNFTLDDILISVEIMRAASIYGNLILYLEKQGSEILFDAYFFSHTRSPLEFHSKLSHNLDSIMKISENIFHPDIFGSILFRNSLRKHQHDPLKVSIYELQELPLESKNNPSKSKNNLETDIFSLEDVLRELGLKFKRSSSNIYHISDRGIIYVIYDLRHSHIKQLINLLSNNPNFLILYIKKMDDLIKFKQKLRVYEKNLTKISIVNDLQELRNILKKKETLCIY